MGLKEATAEKHKMAERMPFNGRMFKGELTNDEYIKYLKSQLAIFSVLEKNFELPSPKLNRAEAVQMDLVALGANQLELYTDPATENYVEYLRGLSHDDAMAHVYLNYLAIMFGGQMMKANTPGPGHMYDFDDMMGAAGSVRAIQKDEWADEVNEGFDFMIEIFKELDK